MNREETIKSLHYFSPLNDPNIDWEKVDLDSIIALDSARKISGVPFIINRNYSTPEHSVAVGGLKDDAHTENPCSAFDIKCKRPDGTWDSQKAFKIIPALIIAGFKRIGAGKNHIHADRSKVLPSGVFWIE